MDSPKIIYKYYSNPAFCSQSEVVFAQKSCVTKMVTPSRRMPPLGGNSPRKNEIDNRIVRTDISDNPLRLTPAGRMRDEPPELPPKPPKYQRQFQRQTSLICKPTRQIVRCRTRSEDLEMAQLRQTQKNKYERNAESDDGLEDSRMKHRYEVIRDIDDGLDYSPTKKRIVEADASEIEEYNVDGPDENEMKEIPTEIVKTVNGKTLRYAIVPSDDEEPRKMNVTFSSPIMSQKNLIATQKLHELLSTPRKLKSYASQPSVRITPNKQTSPNLYVDTPKKLISSTPTQGVTPSKSCANLSIMRSGTSPISPKVPQKLNYGLSDEFQRQDVFVTSFREKSRERSFDMDRREASRESRRNYDNRGRDSQRRDKNTAIIMPRVAPQSPSVYSEETYKSLSSLKAVNSSFASLTIAALMLTLCGGLTTGLSFYMMYTMGRRYYLDFGVLSGFTCFLLGMLGLRSRRNQLLPNRNYISGYIVLSSFSLLSAFGLLILLSVQPLPGTALNDITSGAVCSISIISLCLATIGVLASYCCARDPPDNRIGTTRVTMADHHIREAAESLLESVSNPRYRTVSQTHSVNLTTEDLLEGYRPYGRMSSVRRFFCLFVTFDLLFTSLMWLICVMMKGESLVLIFNREIVQYSIKTSLFDVVLVAILRFLLLILFYAALYINNWSVIALSTGGTCAFLIAKVFVFDWPNASQPVYQVFLILTSFTLAWGEAWFLDFRVLPLEMGASSHRPTVSERTPLLHPVRPAAPHSTYGESTVNWFSPVETPEASPRPRLPGEQVILTQELVS
ncbi:StAR-related lipid transfer protein 3 [Papilio xuthus]|uniref:StAR-related lipid transfer protein 3 n=1 Tax=Papilio xuthus TaxID=66420 RepID=A0A194PZN8_PAPXU|nr:StAR-related lipid transfer protein 3 [Papilio xuthus]